MQESRIEATKRLQRDGRWGEASAYRDEVRQRLRGEGKTRREAGEQAWVAMAEKFPPTEPVSRAVATMVEPATAVKPPAPPRVPPANHCVCSVADLDLQIWSDEYDVDLTDDAKGFLASLMGHYWQAGMQGVLPRPDVFGD
jgi:hypothetical protein